VAKRAPHTNRVRTLAPNRSDSVSPYGNFFSTARSDLFGAFQRLEGLDSGANNVVWVGTAQALRQNVVDTCALENSAQGAARNNPCTGRRRPQKNIAGTEVANDLVWDRCALQRNLKKVLTRLLIPLANCLGNFVGLSEANTHVTRLIAHDHEGRKREAPAALNDLGHAVEMNHPLFELFFVDLMHHGVTLELKSALTGTVSEGFHATVVTVAVSVEYN